MFIYGLGTQQVRVPTVNYCTVRYNHILEPLENTEF